MQSILHLVIEISKSARLSNQESISIVFQTFFKDNFKDKHNLVVVKFQWATPCQIHKETCWKLLNDKNKNVTICYKFCKIQSKSEAIVFQLKFASGFSDAKRMLLVWT